MKISLLITVKNETDTILSLLESIRRQTTLPEEIIVVDGGSQDDTSERIRWFARKFPYLNLKLLTVPGNRSQGRNAAAQAAKHSWYAFTDAGCILAPTWLKNLKAGGLKASVVAGYTWPQAQTAFEHASATYFLPTPDRVSPVNFLPATRSMLICRTTFFAIGGFDETSTVEDYEFALRLKLEQIPVYFCPQARSWWRPPGTLALALKKIAAYANGERHDKIFRPKVLFLITRYCLALFLLLVLPFQVFISLVLAYLGWSIIKNGFWAKKGWFWLPILQLGSDFVILKSFLTYR